MSTPTSTNDERERARQIIEYTSTHLFLTGKAGTGKTTFLRELQQNCPKRMIVLAPTGIAAINAGGSTIHSFFQLPFAPFIPDERYKRMDFKLRKQKVKLIRSLDLIIIDEISMVRADLLDQIDAVLRQYRNKYEPFGGVQLLMIGDLQQLAPVAKEEEWNLLSQYYESPYFFSSLALKQTQYVTIELKTVYRQSDPVFLHLLNCIRSNKADAQVLEQLNRRFIPNFSPTDQEAYIRLVTHNWQAQQINEGELAKIPQKTYVYDAEISGTFPEFSYPTEAKLTLKVGAQIMFIKNDTDKRYYNGTLGEVTALDEKCCTVRTADKRFEMNLEKEEWLNTRYVLNEKTQQIEEKTEGSFRQYPIKLAWAITIHKSQGLTFEKAIIDAHSAFAHGQTYVALSRCKTLEGLVLSSPIPPSAIIQDNAVCQFNERMEQQQPTANSIDQLRHQHCLKLISDLFDFSSIRHTLSATVRLMEESFSKLYPETLKRFNEKLTPFNDRVLTVAEKFQAQYQRLVFANTSESISPELQERLRKGADYFHQQLLPLHEFVQGTYLPTDNKEIQKRATNILDSLKEEILQKCYLLAYVKQNGFEIVDFQRCRALVAAGQPITAQGTVNTHAIEEKAESSSSKKTEKFVVPEGIRHHELYRQLYKWRDQKALEEEVPVYQVLQSKAILGISNILPMDKHTLSMIPYFGTKGLEQYGEELLELIHKYVKEYDVKVENPTLFLKSNEKENPQKENKETSAQQSLRLFKEKKDVAAVAQERGLAISTIYGHLMTCMEEGNLALEDLVAIDKIKTIKSVLKNYNQEEFPSLKELRNLLGENFEYAEIRAVITSLKAKE